MQPLPDSYHFRYDSAIASGKEMRVKSKVKCVKRKCSIVGVRNGVSGVKNLTKIDLLTPIHSLRVYHVGL